VTDSSTRIYVSPRIYAGSLLKQSGINLLHSVESANDLLQFVESCRRNAIRHRRPQRSTDTTDCTKHRIVLVSCHILYILSHMHICALKTQTPLYRLVVDLS